MMAIIEGAAKCNMDQNGNPSWKSQFFTDFFQNGGHVMVNFIIEEFEGTNRHTAISFSMNLSSLQFTKCVPAGTVELSKFSVEFGSID